MPGEKKKSAESARKRTAVYIDGYNLYYGRLRGSDYKWLDVVALSESIIRMLAAPDPLALLWNDMLGGAVAGTCAHEQKTDSETSALVVRSSREQ